MKSQLKPPDANHIRHRSVGSVVFNLHLAAPIGILWLLMANAELAGQVKPKALELLTVSRFSSIEASREKHPIRVNVTPAHSHLLRITIDGPWSLTPVGSTSILGSGKTLSSSELKPGRHGIAIGDREYTVSRIEFVPTTPQPVIWVNNHQYRGKLRVYRQSAEQLLIVNDVDIEDYVASVVDSEMPSAFPDSAREAQAIAARTYALYQQEKTGRHRLFDVFASTRSQKYNGFQYRTPDGRRLAGETRSGRQTADRTRGIVAVSNGKLFCTYYSAVCGGRTTRGDLVFADADPMLQPRSCAWCRASKLFRWQKKCSLESFDSALGNAMGADAQEWSGTLSVASKTVDGVSVVTVSDGRRPFQIDGSELRKLLKSVRLPSPHFDVSLKESTVTFSGRGHGHGVGLCQWGARGQALEGRGTVQILGHYYPQAELLRLDYDR